MNSLSPLVMIMTLFSRFQKFREITINLLNKVIIITSGDNEFIIITSGDKFIITLGDNGNYT